MDLLDLYAKIVLDTGEYDKGIDRSKQKGDTLVSSFRRMQQSSESLGDGISTLADRHEKTQKKVADLTKEVSASAKETGADTDRARDLGKQLGDTGEEAGRLEKNLGDLKEETSDTGKTFDETKVKANGLADKLKNGLATAAKVGAAALAAASTAAAALTKISLESYADYEQLVGGVETLFGAGGKSIEEYAESVGKSVDEARGEYDALLSAQNTVLANASSAYKSAGLSANAYMETVTGFSAALIQSLGGDTEKAASVADTAITDMADNANKMGTAMESIQNAYSGFAKQNFTMLDNLKLGYGGTKEEMERLLKDAAKLPGALGRKFDISNYADIVEAIHLVQDEMGITGTTAREAEKTISGSVASAKAAWTNLVAGLADENADLGDLIGQFVDSAATAGKNIIPRVQQILAGIGAAVQQLGPMISEQLPAIVKNVLPSLLDAGVSLLNGVIGGIVAAAPALVDAAMSTLTSLATYLTENLPMLVESAGQIVTTLVTGIGEALPQLLDISMQLRDTGVQMLDQLVAGIETALPDMVSRLPQILENFLNFITENLPSVLDKGVELLNRLVNGIIGAIPDMVAALPQIITSFVNFIAQNLPRIVSSGIELLTNLITGIIKAIPDLVRALPEIIVAIVKGIGALMGSILNIGKDIVSGIWEGIASMASWIKDKVTGFFGGIVDGVKGLLGIHSPSRVFAGIGENMAAGLGKGWNQEYGRIRKDIEEGMDFTSGDAAGISGAGPADRGYGVNNNRFGNISIIINASPDQDVRELAMAVQNILVNDVFQRRGALA